LIGYIENTNADDRPKYAATIKNNKSNQWFTLKDHETFKRDERSIGDCYANMVFYKRKFDTVREKETKNLKSHVELLANEDFVFDPTRLVYIPNYWFERAISLANPGMIHTWHLLCKHGKIKPSYRDCFFPKSKNLNTSMINTSVMMDSSFIDKSFLMNPEALEDPCNHSILSVENQSIKLPIEIGEYFLERVKLKLENIV